MARKATGTFCIPKPNRAMVPTFFQPVLATLFISSTSQCQWQNPVMLFVSHNANNLV